MNRLRGQEIFAVGTWNGQTFSLDDLRDIASNFALLGDVHRVPLKLGHNDEQKVTDGQPALGWVENVYVRGEKLLADFSDVPTVIFNAIQKKLYRTVSVELLHNPKWKDKVLSFVLDAVALLGADQPAVSGLRDLEALSLSRKISDGERLVFTVARGRRNGTSTGERHMDEELKAAIAAAVKAAVGDLPAQVQTLTADRDKFKRQAEELARKAEEDERTRLTETARRVRTEVTEYLDGAVKAGVIKPAQRESFSRLHGIDKDETAAKIDMANVKALVGWDGVAKKDDGLEDGKSKLFTRQDKQTGIKSENPADIINDAALEVMENSPREITYGEAVRIAMRRNPEAARGWVTMNGDVNTRRVA